MANRLRFVTKRVEQVRERSPDDDEELPGALEPPKRESARLEDPEEEEEEVVSTGGGELPLVVPSPTVDTGLPDPELDPEDPAAIEDVGEES